MVGWCSMGTFNDPWRKIIHLFVPLEALSNCVGWSSQGLPREDKAHTRIGTEARTRRGNLDDLGSQDAEGEARWKCHPIQQNFQGTYIICNYIHIYINNYYIYIYNYYTYIYIYMSHGKWIYFRIPSSKLSKGIWKCHHECTLVDLRKNPAIPLQT